MSRNTRARLNDIVVACEAITGYLLRSDPDDEMLYDAVRVRLIEIGEAVKDLPADLLGAEPAIPWNDIARMRDALAHRYFDASHSIVSATAKDDVPMVEAAARRLLENLDAADIAADSRQ